SRHPAAHAARTARAPGGVGRAGGLPGLGRRILCDRCRPRRRWRLFGCVGGRRPSCPRSTLRHLASMHEIERRVDRFLRSYRTAFSRLEAAQIAAHFAFPLLVASDAGELALTAVPTLADWLPQVERLAAAYGTIGMRSARQEETSVQPVSPRLLQV